MAVAVDSIFRKYKIYIYYPWEVLLKQEIVSLYLVAFCSSCPAPLLTASQYFLLSSYRLIQFFTWHWSAAPQDK